MSLCTMSRVACFSAAVFLVVLPASAEMSHTLLIGGDDGYGTSACLAEGTSCGKVVADALCESHGFAASLDFHKAAAEEITAATSQLTPTQQAFIINCGEQTGNSVLLGQ
jgi:hypothetical protein